MLSKILIVEDEAISALALKYTIERLGYTVVSTVDTGEAAILAAEKYRPDLILMDTRLRSDMTGVEAANTIWEQFYIRSVFVSAYTQAEIEKEYRGALPVILLGKPVLDKDIEQLIKQFNGMN